MKRIVNIAAGFGLLCCLFTLSQCGLETIAYLSPPVSLSPWSSPPYFRFQKTTENDLPTQIDIFEGFEIYYKFYRPDDTKDTDIVERSELISKGFHRLSRYPEDKKDDPNKPLVEVTSTGVVDFKVDIETLIITDVPVTATYVADIRRGIPYETTNELKDFDYVGGDFEAADADVGDTIYNWMLANLGVDFYMLAYALSYGRADFVDVYSEAEFLGEILVNFGW